MSSPLNRSTHLAHDVASGRALRNTAQVLRLPLLLLLLAMLAIPAQAAPEYALSGRAAQLDAIAIAQTDFGPLTALDLLIFDDLSGLNALASVPIEVWMDLDSLAAEPHLYYIEATAANLVATFRLGERVGQWQPRPDHLRAMTFNAAIATWIHETVIPQVNVTSTDIQRYYLAHGDEYLERQHAQVRYIFLEANLENAEETDRVTAELEQIAFNVREGHRSFDQAARQSSQAPSAVDGGLLPPFLDGTYFKEFETQAFALTTQGDLSSVFKGPDGLYLIQLENIRPINNIAVDEVAEAIAERLQYDHVRHYYAYLYKELDEKSITANHAAGWSYMNMDTPIAYVGQATLSRNQFLRYFENPTDEQFAVRWNVVFGHAAGWIEGETIMQDLEKRGLDRSPWIKRAEAIALAIQRGRRVLSHEVPGESYRDAQAALKTLESQPGFNAMLRQCRLVEFDYAPKSTREMTAGDRRAADRLVSRIDLQLTQGMLPTEPNVIDLAAWTVTLGEAGEADLAAPLEEMRMKIIETAWGNLDFAIHDFGWVESFPGSSWHGLIGSGAIGSVSEAYRMGSRLRRYLLVSERPINREKIMENPLLLCQLAHDMAGYGIFLKEALRIQEAGEVKFVY